MYATRDYIPVNCAGSAGALKHKTLWVFHNGIRNQPEINMTVSTVSNVLDLTTNVPSLASSAMLVELSISAWTGRKKDKQASKQVTDSAGADAAVAGVHKALLADCEQLTAIRTLIGEVRNHVHYRYTLPWSDTGLRLLPTSNFFDYQQEVTRYEGLIAAQVDDLIDNYEHAKSLARDKLGRLFNDDDYPCADSLRDKFRFRVSYIPLPDAGDFRVDLQDGAMKSLRAQYESAYSERITQAMNDVWQRVHTALCNMSERLGYNDDGKPLVFRDSLVENAVMLVDLMDRCNITGDAHMAAVADKLRDTLYAVTPADLREDTAFRDRTKRDIDAILKQLPSLDI